MTDWRTVALADVTTWLSGGTPRKSESIYWEDGTIPWISAISLKGERLADSDRRVTEAAIGNGTRLAPRDSTLILVRGMSLLEEIRVGRCTKEMAFNQDVKALVSEAGVLDPRFLTYALLARRPEILGMVHLAGHGTGVLATERLKSLRLTLPDLPTQAATVGVLEAMDDLVETNRGQINRLRSQIRAIVQASIASDGTREVPLFEAVHVDFGAPFGGESFTTPGTGLPLLRIRDLKTFSSDTWTTQRLPNDVVVQPGDVVVGMDAEFLPTYWLGQPSLLNQRVCRVRMAHPGSPAFACEALAKPLAEIEGSKTGTTVIHLNKADLERIRIRIPDDMTLAGVSAAAEPLREALVDLANEITDLARTRDELLPLLMSGRVRPGEVVS